MCKIPTAANGAVALFLFEASLLAFMDPVVSEGINVRSRDLFCQTETISLNAAIMYKLEAFRPQTIGADVVNGYNPDGIDPCCMPHAVRIRSTCRTMYPFGGRHCISAV